MEELEPGYRPPPPAPPESRNTGRKCGLEWTAADGLLVLLVVAIFGVMFHEEIRLIWWFVVRAGGQR